jgi:oxygen-independent coproporphyrinogen III oxidase
MNESLGVYVSVPFCKAKCSYCNFASGVFGAGTAGAERMERYVGRVCAEIGAVRGRVAGVGRDVELSGRVDSVFFGGGTPSLLSAEQMRRIFAALRGEFAVDAGAEITLECAPGQLGEEVLGELLRQGMNRVSFGVQSFVDSEAAGVGRLHTRAMCLAEIARVRAAGVENVNVDLIVGLPGQTAESWRTSVEVAIETGVPHVSVYILELDEDSRLGREVLAGGTRYGAGATASGDEAADRYAAACDWLAGAGVEQYEISNFGRAGWASRHNVKYWRREGYLGFGLDAHSMLRVRGGDEADAVRWANGEDLEAYLGGAPDGGGLRLPGAVCAPRAPGVEVIGREQGFEEAMFLGLRMNCGVDMGALRREFGARVVGEAVAALRDVEEAGLVEREGDWVRLTARGRMASNEVFGRLLVAAV